MAKTIDPTKKSPPTCPSFSANQIFSTSEILLPSIALMAPSMASKV